MTSMTSYYHRPDRGRAHRKQSRVVTLGLCHSSLSLVSLFSCLCSLVSSSLACLLLVSLCVSCLDTRTRSSSCYIGTDESLSVSSTASAHTYIQRRLVVSAIPRVSLLVLCQTVPLFCCLFSHCSCFLSFSFVGGVLLQFECESRERDLSSFKATLS